MVIYSGVFAGKSRRFGELVVWGQGVSDAAPPVPPQCIGGNMQREGGGVGSWVFILIFDAMHYL